MTENKNQQTSIENFEPNVIAAFAYFIPPLSGILFFLLEKKSKFVRFHALQSVLFGAVAYAIKLLLQSLSVLYIGYILGPLVTLGGFALWLLLIWKAYQYEEFMLPYIGKAAKDNSGFVQKAPKNSEDKKEDTKSNDQPEPKETESNEESSTTDNA